MIDIRHQPKRMRRDIGTVTDIGTVEMIAAVTGEKIQIWRGKITSGAAQDIIIKQGSTTIATYYNVTEIDLPYDGHPHWETASGAALNITTETADDVSWVLDYGTDVSVGPGGPNRV
jgi:hypothetical protein